MLGRATHIRKKTGQKVYVHREYGTIIVRSMKSNKVLGTYEQSNMKKFYKRYKSLRAEKMTG